MAQHPGRQCGSKRQSRPVIAGPMSAAMTLDVYADLFDSDLDDVAKALDLAVAEIFELKMGL